MQMLKMGQYLDRDTRNFRIWAVRLVTGLSLLHE